MVNVPVDIPTGAYTLAIYYGVNTATTQALANLTIAANTTASIYPSRKVNDVYIRFFNFTSPSDLYLDQSLQFAGTDYTYQSSVLNAYPYDQNLAFQLQYSSKPPNMDAVVPLVTLNYCHAMSMTLYGITTIMTTALPQHF